MIAARETTGRHEVVCSEHTHSAVEKGARMIGMTLRKVATDDQFRLRVDELGDLSDAAVVVTVRHHGQRLGRSRPGDRRCLCGRGHLAARRRRLCRQRHDLPRVSLGLCRRRAGRLAGGQPAQVDADADGLLAAREPAGRPPAARRLQRSLPQFLRTPDAEDALSLSEYGPALGRRFRALKLWAVLRCYGRSGLQEHIRRGVALASMFEEWVAAEPGWEVSAPRHFSLVCFRLEGDDARSRALLERVNAGGEIFISHAVLAGRYVLRLAVGQMSTTEADIHQAWEVLRNVSQTLES